MRSRTGADLERKAFDRVAGWEERYELLEDRNSVPQRTWVVMRRAERTRRICSAGLDQQQCRSRGETYMQIRLALSSKHPAGAKVLVAVERPPQGLSFSTRTCIPTPSTPALTTAPAPAGTAAAKRRMIKVEGRWSPAVCLMTAGWSVSSNLVETGDWRTRSVVDCVCGFARGT